jgi:serine/threonine protein kinase
MPLEGTIIPFLRKKDYLFLRALGQGACGQTVLLIDQDIQQHVVCKKYVPYDEAARVSLYQNFVREIKLLYQLHHPNVVRYFHHYLYPEITAGYILMEYIDGKNIDEHTKAAPEQINDLFLQAIDGFAYLETTGIMHRDIRPNNVLVTKDGRLRIIDLGFGKHAVTAEDFRKSITLNWFCEVPADFREERYDFTTEVYFVGKLFEQLIRDHQIEHFSYKDVLRGMCAFERQQRTTTFAEIQQRLRTGQFPDSGFSPNDIEVYREFAIVLSRHVTKIAATAKYHTDIDRLVIQLTDIHRRCLLEETVPDAATVTRCFIKGGYYSLRSGFPTSTVTAVLGLIKRATTEQRKIIMANLHTRLDAIERYWPPPVEDDVPF